MSPGASDPDLTRPIRRVAFTCDFLRFSPEGHGYTSFQPRNLAWLFEVLTSAPAWKRLGVQMSMVMPPTQPRAFERALGNRGALSEYRNGADHAWARRYDVEHPDLLASVFDELCDYDLVIGFEMAPTIKRWLHSRGRLYLNLYVHPLRFLRDLCFGATTNSPQMADLLRTHEIASSEVDTQVHRFRGLFRRQQPAACAIPAGLPLLIGQTERDSVLIKDGRFETWDDHAESLAVELAGFDAVAFLEHPYRPSSSVILERLRSVHGKTVISTNANGYGVLFANREVPCVLTLASSLGVEAQAAGHDTRFLLADPRQKFDVLGVDQAAAGPVRAYGHGLLMPSFWDAVLGDRAAIQGQGSKRSADDFALGDNYLRNSLDAWSFRALQNGVSNITSRKTLLPASGLSEARRNALLGGMTGDNRPQTPAQAFTRAHALGLQFTLLDPPVATGEQRDVGLDGPAAVGYLANGFHPPESWGGWSSELLAQVVIPVDADALKQRAHLDVSMRVRAFDGLLPKAPVLRIGHNGQSLGFVFFRASGVNQQTISFSVVPTGPLCLIDLEMSDLESPAARGISADQRWLGFALSQLSVACRLPDDGDPSSAPPILWGVASGSVAASQRGVVA